MRRAEKQEETIFFAWLRHSYFITSSPISDFEVEGITFEIGGMLGFVY